MIEQTLKTLVDRFDNLSMRNPVIQTAMHPYNVLATNFPTYNDFYNYFIDLTAATQTQEEFGDVLFQIYHDLRELPVLVSGFDNGIKPENMEKIHNSMRKFTELTKKKYTQANAALAQGYNTKQ